MELGIARGNKSYDKKSFTQPVNDFLECPICFDIMKDPVLCTAQGHTFCRECVTKHLDQSETCPTCREPMRKEKLLPNRLVRSMIEDAEVHCFSYDFVEENKVKGKKRKLKDTVESCEWTGKLKDAEAHYNQCQFALTNCPHDGCDDVFIRKDHLDHVEDCIHRPVVCEWCEIVKSADAIDLHLRWCSNRPVPCPNKCLDVNREVLKFLPSDMDHHRALCAMELVDCAFVECGCKTKLQRKDMPLHEQDVGAHMVYFFGALQTAQKKIALLEEVVMNQNVKITDLDQVSKAQEEVIKSLHSGSAQIVLRVPISELNKTNISQTVHTRGCDFNVRLLPSPDHPGWQSLYVYLLGSSLVDSVSSELDFSTVCDDPIPLQLSPSLIVNVFRKSERKGRRKFIETTTLQNPPYAKNGHISIKVNITLLSE
jgi:hypothetical protein